MRSYSNRATDNRFNLGRDVGVVVVLKQQSGRLDVVLFGRDVQRRKSNFASKVVLQQHGDHLVVTLLQSNGQGRESVLHNPHTC